MDFSKIASDWARAEVYSSWAFILFGIAFIVSSLGFWQLAKTDLSKAYTIPTFVAGVLILVIGVGIFAQSQSRVKNFPIAYSENPAAFVQSETIRSDKVLKQYRISVFQVIPFIIAVCAVLTIFFQAPIWRASLITTIAMMSVLLLIDSNADARLEKYRQVLLLAK